MSVTDWRILYDQMPAFEDAVVEAWETAVPLLVPASEAVPVGAGATAIVGALAWPRFRETFRAGLSRVYRAILDAVNVARPTGFPPMSTSAIERVIESLADSALGGIERTIRRTLDGALTRALGRGEALADELAEVIRWHVWLTPRESVALDTYIMAQRVAATPAVAPGMPAATPVRFLSLGRRVVERIGGFWERLKGSRGRILGETEVEIGIAIGDDVIWGGADRGGVIHRDAEEEWITVDDEMRCTRCARMHGQRVPRGQPFMLDGKVVTQPLHPRCRCRRRLHYTLAKSLQEAA